MPTPSLYLLFVLKVGFYLGRELTGDALRIDSLWTGLVDLCEFESTLVCTTISRAARAMGWDSASKKGWLNKTLSYSIQLIYFIFSIEELHYIQLLWEINMATLVQPNPLKVPSFLFSWESTSGIKQKQNLDFD